MHITKGLGSYLGVALAAGFLHTAQADIRLPAVYSDHAVLQQGWLFPCGAGQTPASR